ncbi:hypothetical protein [Streptomyces sp. NPDC059491]|uniref:hypothetical protein n=1 Tax=Streptomyces sp. NPDC059491 TaxID=3346850 RepID=UPI0036A6E7C6
MNHSTPRLRALAALPFVLALAAHLLLFTRWRDALPAELATHYSLGDGGQADGWTSRAGYLVISTALIAGLAAGWCAFVRRRSLWGAWATAGFIGGLFVQLLRTNLVDAFETQVSAPAVDLAVAGTAAVAAGLVGLALTSVVPEDEPVGRAGPPDGPRLALGAGEVAGWSRSTGSRPLTVLAFLALAATPVVLLVVAWPDALLGLLGLVVGVPGLALARVRVTVDRHGLTVRSGVLPRPRVRIALDEIAGADVRDVDALGDFGGWGYRVRAHRTGVVLRSGEALVVRRDSGREFAVTVPDAATAAALLNTLAERHGKV